MRNGRTGVFVDENNALQVGVVVAVYGRESVDVQVNTYDGDRETVRVSRPNFHRIDISDSRSGKIPDFIRNHFGVELDFGQRRVETPARGFTASQESQAPAATQFGTVGRPNADTGVSVDEEGTVTFSDAIIDGIRSMVKQLLHKKKPTGVYKATKKASVKK